MNSLPVCPLCFVALRPPTDVRPGKVHTEERAAQTVYTNTHTQTHTLIQRYDCGHSEGQVPLNRWCAPYFFFFLKLGLPKGLWPTSGAILQADTRIIIQTTDLNQSTYWGKIIWANNISAFVPSPDLICLSALSVTWGLIQAWMVYFRIFVLLHTFVFTPTISPPSLPRLQKTVQNYRHIDPSFRFITWTFHTSDLLQWIVNFLWIGSFKIQLVILKTIKLPLKPSNEWIETRWSSVNKNLWSFMNGWTTFNWNASMANFFY